MVGTVVVLQKNNSLVKTIPQNTKLPYLHSDSAIDSLYSLKKCIPSMNNHGYTSHTAENDNVGRRSKPILHPDKATPAAPTTHNHHFTDGPALQPNHGALQRCQTDTHSRYAAFGLISPSYHHLPTPTPSLISGFPGS